MENVLIISGNKTAAETLAGFIRESFQCSVRAVESGYQAKSIISSDPALDLALINTPLIDESGMELAEYMIENSTANCILIIKPENAAKNAERAEKNGIIVMLRPVNKGLLYQLVKTVDIALRRSVMIFQEKQRLERQIEEIKTIDKAKFMLMEYKSMSEAEAHGYLEQYAMNKRKKKYIAALELIDKIHEQYL